MWDEEARASGWRFSLPLWRAAVTPPEVRGAGRDDVRLLVTRGSTVEHRRFRQLPEVLGPGDLVVFNASQTIPAAVDCVRRDGELLRLHVCGSFPQALPEERLVELRRRDQAWFLGRSGERLEVPCGAIELIEATSEGRFGPRLWRAALRGGDWTRLMTDHGEPIRYDYVRERWPMRAYETAVGRVPGSAEMPSAGRPFTAETLVRLRARGIQTTSVVLHTGLASPEAGERPYDEWYSVSAEAVAAIAAAKRVIAVGTTVVRALESAARGGLRASSGWTDHLVGPETPPQVVSGLITGFHEPRSTHLAMLRAIAGSENVRRAYESALAGDYLWHEFGDLHLLFP